jgi:hypothetical protein
VKLANVKALLVGGGLIDRRQNKVPDIWATRREQRSIVTLIYKRNVEVARNHYKHLLVPIGAVVVYAKAVNYTGIPCLRESATIDDQMASSASTSLRLRHADLTAVKFAQR